MAPRGPRRDVASVVHLPLWAVSARSGAVQSLFEICVEKRRTGRAKSGSLCALSRQPQFCVSTGARQQSSQPASIGDVI